MSHLSLEFFSAHSLKRAVKLIRKFVKPANEAIFCFWPERASLQALSYDGRIRSFVHFDREIFSRYICEHSCSYTLNIDEFNAVVNLAADSNSLSIIGTPFEDFLLTIPQVETFVLQVLSMELYIDPLPKASMQPIVKIALQTRIFKAMLYYFGNFKCDNERRMQN